MVSKDYCIIGENIWYFLSVYYECVYWPILMARYLWRSPVLSFDSYFVLSFYINFYCLLPRNNAYREFAFSGGSAFFLRGLAFLLKVFAFYHIALLLSLNSAQRHHLI